VRREIYEIWRRSWKPKNKKEEEVINNVGIL